MSRLVELRLKFNEKLKQETREDFDQRDVEKLTEEKYLNRVLEQCEGNIEAATKMLYSIIVWRKENRVSDIKDLVRMDYIHEGLFCPHGRDLDGCLLLILKWKLHTKGQKDLQDLKKMALYWLERLEREEDGRPITLFFDLDGCGKSNVEVDLVVYMIAVLKSYYPEFIHQIIIFQMPWIMSAGFRLIKGLLPATAVQKLRIVTKDKLSDYVHPDQALKSWGGGSDYTFHFIPESTKKHVTFADKTNTLEVIPSDSLTFVTTGNEANTVLTIVNTGDGKAAYKIRTTGPEKFRVKPRSGVLLSNSRMDVSISVLPGFDATIAIRERFLVLTTPVTDDAKPLEDVFQSAKTTSEFRLKCKMADEPVIMSPVMEALDVIQKKHMTLLKGLDVLKVVQMVTLSLTTLTVTLGYMVYGRTIAK